MLMHFAALCFHFPPLCLPESRARHTRPSQGEGRAAREDEETDKWGGREEEKTTGQTSEQATTKAFFVCNKKRSNLPFFFIYLNFFLPSWLARKTRREGCESGENGRAERARKSEKSEEKRLGEAQAHERQAERGINERGGEGRQGGRQL